MVSQMPTERIRQFREAGFCLVEKRMSEKDVWGIMDRDDGY